MEVGPVTDRSHATAYVSDLTITPVKGLRLHHVNHVDVSPDGVSGDRLFYLVNSEGRHRSCTALGALLTASASYDETTDELTVFAGEQVLRRAVCELGDDLQTDFYGLRAVEGKLVADASWHEFFSELAGESLRLVRARSSAYDVRPLTLIGKRSIQRILGGLDRSDDDADRFRMNVVLEGLAAFEEDGWQGQRYRIGGATLFGAGRVKRCAATTRNPGTGVVDTPTPNRIVQGRGRLPTPLGLGPALGVYAEVEVAGRITLGDEVILG